MSLWRGVDGSEPVRPEPIVRRNETQEERRSARSWHLGSGTLACPRCDAPVALVEAHLSPADALGCPFCGHPAAVREFLSLATPGRPARVEVRVVHRARPTVR